MQNHPFSYDLHPHTIKGSDPGAILCLHGWGGSYRIAEQLGQAQLTQTLISFNFPDHDLRPGKYIPEETSFGTIAELLPALYMLKKCVLEEKIAPLSIYGFSAGGGVLINLFTALCTARFDGELQSIGIRQPEKKALLQALIDGYIILDTPFRSVEEIIAHRGKSHDLNVAQERYGKNNLMPINSLNHLAELPLKVILHFQLPDEVLSNRDDIIFARQLMLINRSGKTWVIIGNDGGHGALHGSLWNFYTKYLM